VTWANKYLYVGYSAPGAVAVTAGGSVSCSSLSVGTVDLTNPGPGDITYGDSLTDWSSYFGCEGTLITGATYRRSMVRLRDVRDGASQTYLVGEKCLNPRHYLDGKSIDDNQGWDSSFCYDVIRWTGIPSSTNPKLGVASATVSPMQDTVGPDSTFPWKSLFGSAHSNSFNMALCDGSVHAISYTIDPETHHRLGNIADGQPVDAKAF
jgi:prepilin-type processing-associated H-X9-DG protein